MSVTSPSTRPISDYWGQLPLQKRLLEAIVESTMDAVLVVSGAGEMTYFNQRFVELWGIPSEVLATRRSQDAQSAVKDTLADPEAFVARVAYLYAHPLESGQDELEFRDGRIVERFTGPVTDDSGDPQGRV